MIQDGFVRQKYRRMFQEAEDKCKNCLIKHNCNSQEFHNGDFHDGDLIENTNRFKQHWKSLYSVDGLEV